MLLQGAAAQFRAARRGARTAQVHARQNPKGPMYCYGGIGFRIQGLGVRVLCTAMGPWGLGFRVLGPMYCSGGYFPKS